MSDKVTIISNYHWRETDYAVPDWGVDEEECFTYRGETYFLSEFGHTRNPILPDWLREWQGYQNDSFFSGILVRYATPADEENGIDYGMIQVATFIT